MIYRRWRGTDLGIGPWRSVAGVSGSGLSRAVVCMVVCALALAGCTGRDSQRSRATVAADGVTLDVAGVAVSIPPGAATGEGELALAPTAGAPPGWPDGDGSIVPLTAVEVSLVGAELVGEATVEFSGHQLAPGLLPVVIWQDGSGGWELLPSQTAEDGSVLARTTHFSWGFLAAFDPAGWLKDHAQDWGRNLLGRAGADQPSCGDEKTPREAGVEVISDRGDAVKWCFGIEGGTQILRVTNNKNTFVEVTYPKTWGVEEDSTIALSTDALARAFGGLLVEASSGRSARVVDAGDTLTLTVPQGGGGRAVTQISTLAWALSGIAMGLEVYGLVAGSLKASAVAQSSTGTFQRILDKVSGADLEGYGEAFRDCGEKISDATEHGDDIDKWFATLWTGCVPALMRADIAATGLKMWALGQVLKVITTAVTAVYTAGAIITSGMRELWDTAFAPMERGSNVYRIKVTPPTPEALTLIRNPYSVFYREWDSYGFKSSAGLIARQDGEDLYLSWISEFHRPCLVAQWTGQVFEGTYYDLETRQARALPFRGPGGQTHLRVWADGWLYTGTDEDWVESSLDEVRASGAEMFDGPVEDYVAGCGP